MAGGGTLSAGGQLSTSLSWVPASLLAGVTLIEQLLIATGLTCVYPMNLCVELSEPLPVFGRRLALQIKKQAINVFSEIGPTLEQTVVKAGPFAERQDVQDDRHECRQASDDNGSDVECQSDGEHCHDGHASADHGENSNRDFETTIKQSPNTSALLMVTLVHPSHQAQLVLLVFESRRFIFHLFLPAVALPEDGPAFPEGSTRLVLRSFGAAPKPVHGAVRRRFAL